jgi:importin-7
MVAQIFPSLVNIATQMMSRPPDASQEFPTMLHLILKTYKTSIVLQLSQHQQSAESLVPWGRLLFAVVNLQIPKEAVPDDESERERSEWWKAKKWAYYTLGRLFHRFVLIFSLCILSMIDLLLSFGNPSQLPSVLKKEYGAFAQHFVTTFAPEIFKIYLQQVELFISGHTWLSRKCQYQIFQFFTEWLVISYF